MEHIAHYLRMSAAAVEFGDVDLSREYGRELRNALLPIIAEKYEYPNTSDFDVLSSLHKARTHTRRKYGKKVRKTKQAQSLATVSREAFYEALRGNFHDAFDSSELPNKAGTHTNRTTPANKSEPLGPSSGSDFSKRNEANKLLTSNESSLASKIDPLYVLSLLCPRCLCFLRVGRSATVKIQKVAKPYKEEKSDQNSSNSSTIVSYECSTCVSSPGQTARKKTKK